MSEGITDTFRNRLIRMAEDFHWVSITLGLVGNTAFFVGSVFFLWEATKLAGIWLFIIGSLGMLLGSIGDKTAQLERES